MVMLGGAPNVPDPSQIVKSGAEVAKAIATGGVSVGMDLAEGVRKVLFQTVEGGARTVDGAVKEVVNIAKANIEAGKATIESVHRDIDQACNSVLSQTDQAVGQEVVRKFKSEVERRLR